MDAVQWIDRTPTPVLARSGRPVSVYGGLIVPEHRSDFCLYVPGEYALLGAGGWAEMVANLGAVGDMWKHRQQGRES